MKIDYLLASQGYLIDINLPFDAAASGEVSLVLQPVLGESQFVGSSKNSTRIQQCQFESWIFHRDYDDKLVEHSSNVRTQG